MTDEESKMQVTRHSVIDGIRKNYLLQRGITERPWYDRFIIAHDNPYLQTWNVAISIVTVLSAFTNMYITAFEVHALQSHDFEHLDSVVIWMLIQEYSFGIDIIITFLTEYTVYTEDHGLDKVPVRKFSKIAIRYLKSVFIVDFMAFYPFFIQFEHYFVDEEKEHLNVYTYFHLCFMFRLFRLYKAAELLDP